MRRFPGRGSFLKSILVLTFARSEYGSTLPVIRTLQNAPGVDLQVVVAGSHLVSEFGQTVRLIEADGVPIAERVETQLAGDSRAAASKSLGVAILGLTSTLERLRPDCVLINGDRLELLAIASVTTALGIPLAHISGGDITEGALDNQVRYAVTQLSHLHFTCMPEHAERLLQQGEEPWRIHVTGDPALDHLNNATWMTRAELEQSLELPLTGPVALVTYHPTTLAGETSEREADAFVSAIEDFPGTLVISAPNPDADRRAILERLERLAARHPRARLIASFGQHRYYSLMASADVIIGNSSSGIWEAPSFRLPAVNVGDRQRGRLRAGNVIDVPPDRQSIRDGVRRALTPEFRRSLAGMVNPYGDGHAAERIVAVLRDISFGPSLLQKRFVRRAVSADSRANSCSLAPEPLVEART